MQWICLKTVCILKHESPVVFVGGDVCGIHGIKCLDEPFDNIIFFRFYVYAVGVGKLFRCEIEKQEPPQGKTLIITNPPYGERIEVEDIYALYDRIGTALKSKHEGNTAWVISSDFEALKRIGLKPSKKIPIYNSNLECRFCKFELYHGTRRYGKGE